MTALLLSASCGARSPLSQPNPPETSVACTDGTIALELANPTLMLTIDRSASMNDVLEKGETESRWELLTSALSSTLPAVNGSMAIGALLYPSASTETHGPFTCDVAPMPDLAPAVGNVTSLLALMQSTSPGGATPTADAIDVAGSSLLGARAATGARALVLATDGGPNCNLSADPATCQCVLTDQACNSAWMCLDEARTVQAITKYAGLGIPTYVIGIQGEADHQFTSVLNAMADAGGRPNLNGGDHYYAARSADELSLAFSTIRDQVKCTYLTTSIPGEKGSIVVTLNGQDLSYDPTGMTGWKWGSQSNGEIILSPPACAVAGQPGAYVSADVKCGK